jgi:DMSO/TMAO reductase YedYZ heme-binding membrane subunit
MARGSDATGQRITRDDLERRFSALQGELRGKVADRKQTLITAAGVAAAVLLLIVFLLGKRSGKRKTTLVEIRRV